MSVMRFLSPVAALAVMIGGAADALAQNEALERAPSMVAPDERALILYHEGRHAMDRGELAVGARHFREALSLDPSLQVARQDYAHVLLAAGRPERAQSVLALGLELVPGDSSLARMLVRVARENGDIERAIRVLESIRPDADAEEITLRAHLAELYRETERYDQAARLYAELQTVEPTASKWILGEATSLDHLGATAEAAMAWAELMDHDDIDPSIRRYAEMRLASLRDTLIPYGD